MGGVDTGRRSGARPGRRTVGPCPDDGEAEQGCEVAAEHGDATCGVRPRRVVRTYRWPSGSPGSVGAGLVPSAGIDNESTACPYPGHDRNTVGLTRAGQQVQGQRCLPDFRRSPSGIVGPRSRRSWSACPRQESTRDPRFETPLRVAGLQARVFRADALPVWRGSRTS